MRIESLRELHTQFPDIDGYWVGGDLSVTEAKIRSAIPAVNDGKWSLEAVEAMTHLVRVLNLQNKMTEAEEALKLIRTLVVDLPPGQSSIEIRLLLEEGRHLCINMMPFKAQPYFNKAWTLASEKGEVYFAIEAAVMLSISQPPKYQNEWLLKAIALAESAEGEKAKLWLAQLYLMEGWHAFDFRRMEDALKSFNRALARPRVPGEMTEVIRIRWCIARCLRELGRTQEALDIQRELLAELTAEGKVNGHVFLEMAECMQLVKKKEEAKTYFELAYKELSNNGWYTDNKAPELSRMQNLSKKRY